jgi:hypothetical protein
LKIETENLAKEKQNGFEHSAEYIIDKFKKENKEIKQTILNNFPQE